MRLEFLGELDGLAAGLGFAHHVDVGFGGQEGAEALADDGVVVGEQNGDLGRAWGGVGWVMIWALLAEGQVGGR